MSVPHEAPRYGAVIVNYNGAADAIACAQSLLAARLKPAAVVIVDNCSADDSFARLTAWGEKGEFCHTIPACWEGAGQTIHGAFTFLRPDADPPCARNQSAQPGQSAEQPSVILLKTHKNLGYAHGNNVGIAWLLHSFAPEYLLILNNDTLVEASAPERLVLRMEATPTAGQRVGQRVGQSIGQSVGQRVGQSIGLCGALIRYQDAPQTIQCLGGGFHVKPFGLSRLHGQGADYAARAPLVGAVRSLDFIYGACVMARAAFIDHIGLMDEGYFLFCEEQDWAFRARGAWTLAVEPAAEVLHAEGRATGVRKKGLGNWRRNRILLRSRLRLAMKFHPWWLPTVCLGQLYALARKVGKR